MQRKLTLATSALKRIIKDVEVSYIERDTEIKRMEKMQSEGQDDFRMNQQRTVVAQAVQSITDYKNMLQKAIDKVEITLKEAHDDVTILEADITAAKDMIVKAREVLK